MSRRLAALLWAWAFLALAHVGPSQTVAPAADVIEQARARLAQGQARAAVDLLEVAVPRLSVARRGAALALLREAYPAAIREAEAAGSRRAAANLRENAAILERAARHAGAEPLPETPPPATSAGVAAPVTRAQAPPAPPGALAGPAPVAKEAGGLAALSDRTAPEAATAPAPPAVADDAATEVAASTAPEPEPAPAPAPAPDSNRALLERADAAFRAKDYAKAGQLYSALNAAEALPEVRLDPWAYCRMVTVVGRINAGPKGAPEWAAIRAETEQIRQLSPKNWYAEYLRNLTTELAAAPRRGDGAVVLRGSSPEERPAAAAATSTTRVARRAPPESVGVQPLPAPAAAGDAVVGAAGTPLGTWQVWETTNFRILHGDVALAQRAARVAEATRAEQLRRWAGPEATAPWAPRCDVYLYPSSAVFAQMTGQPADSPGFSTMGLNAGRVVARRVNLRADHANLLAAVLPHEVTHVVLADLFPDLQIPRWADEGIAVLAEPDSEQSLRAADLTKPLEAGQLFALGDLMRMDYPDGKHWSLYYAQSVSLTRFLVSQGTPAQFVEFVRGSQRNGVEPELRRIYGIDGLDRLQDRWLAYARGGPTAVAVAEPEATPAASVAR
jgi:hypothetical protein